MSNELTVSIPKQLNFKNAMELSRRIEALPREGRVLFDFGDMNFVGPFAFVLISARVRDLVQEMPPESVFVKNHTKHSYHGHMGFFKAFGVDFGNAPGGAKGSGTYLPITIEKVVDLQRAAAQVKLPVGEVVEGKARRLATILAGKEDGEIIETFTYSLCEIIRNVAEHSQSKALQYCAQYWPSQDRAEIAILDRGVGICETLSKNPFLKIESEQHALNLSLLPGISGKCFKGAKQKQTSEWQNSGYGLYMTSRMCRHGGNFFLGSHSTSVALAGDSKFHFPFGFRGTIARLVFRPSALGKIKKVLAQFDSEGRSIAKKLDGTSVSGESASRMIRTDFSES